MRGTRVTPLLVLLALATAAPGCGGDEDSSGVTAPERTVPESTQPETSATETTTGEATTQAPSSGGSGGSSAPAPKTSREDSPENDVPPPADSPAERFERECERNPEACG